MSYPQIYLKPYGIRWLTPPNSGRIITLLIYWAVITYMLTSSAIDHDAYYYERIGFRGAWISVTQVPLVYLLASKSSVIGLLIGSSHERLNWLHRWVSRTLLVTVTIHGGFFFREWVRADFVKFELQLMPMVKYGLGAWALLVWTFITSLSPLRRMDYEVFVLQHIAAAAVFLWLLWVHVPSYAQYNVIFAITALSFDFVIRFLLACYKNFRLRVIGPACKGMQRIGHTAQLQTMGSDITVITIQDVPLKWKAGQHLYFWLPWLGPLESHPFTIASPYNSPNECPCNDIQFAIKAQKGFSKRIHKFAEKMEVRDRPAILKAFVSGPYGAPPRWEAYETLLLISASTGASFTLPILECVLSSRQTVCVRRVKVLLVAKQRRHISFYTERLTLALERARAVGIELDVEIAITGVFADDSGEEESIKSLESSIESSSREEKVDKGEHHVLVKEDSGSLSNSSESEQEKGCCSGVVSDSQAQAQEKVTCCTTTSKPKPCTNDLPAASLTTSTPLLSTSTVKYTTTRPQIVPFIRAPVEVTGGETMVAVCGGKSLVSTVRNAVAGLSDERAVHKGSGAQGIGVWAEEYCF